MIRYDAQYRVNGVRFELQTNVGIRGPQGAPGADGRSLEFVWDGTRLGVRVQGESTYQYTELKGADGSPGIPGPQGEPGKGFAVLGYYATAGELAAAQISPGAGDAYGVGSAEPYEIYIWDAVNHIWRNNGQLQGERGEPGQPGADGKSLEFNWSGTQLGVRVAGTSNYTYVDLKGATGEPGADGAPGAPGADGYTPQRGVDYWTAADQAQIVQDVLAALPNASGVSF